jgi:hypothetical protein
MLLDIQPEVFDTAEHLPVVRLLLLILDGQHEWRPTLPAADAADRFARTKMPNSALLEFVQKCLTEAVSSPGRAKAPAVRVTAEQLQDLVEDLKLPAFVIVEDGLSDRSFILFIARAFGRDFIRLAEGKNWLRFVHAGGADRMPQFAEQERQRFRVLVRVVALLDSDRHVPHQRTPKHDHADAVRGFDCSVHVWDGKEAENYIPSCVWQQIHPREETKVNMLSRMTPRQRSYLDIKRGLGDTTETDAEVAQLFHDLPDETRRTWRAGLGRIRQIPDSVVVTERDFEELGSDAVEELRKVLDMIERVL